MIFNKRNKSHIVECKKSFGTSKWRKYYSYYLHIKQIHLIYGNWSGKNNFFLSQNSIRSDRFQRLFIIIKEKSFFHQKMKWIYFHDTVKSASSIHYFRIFLNRSFNYVFCFRLINLNLNFFQSFVIFCFFWGIICGLDRIFQSNFNSNFIVFWNYRNLNQSEHFFDEIFWVNKILI